MANRGHLIVLQLILMYEELKKAKVTARTLSPICIFVDTLCESMTFSDLTALVYHDEPVFDDPVVRMPYNNQYNGVNWNTSRTSSDWDLWSIGMMTLEVIVGTELVLPLHTHECVESLMTDIRAHIPGPTHQLLTEMLFQVSDEQALINSKSDFFKNIYKFEEAINSIENAKMGNIIIKRRVETFKAYAQDHEKELDEAYHWNPNLENN